MCQHTISDTPITSLYPWHVQLNNTHYGTLKSNFISDIYLTGYLRIPSFTDYWNLHELTPS